MAIERIEIVELTVTDLDRATAFYRRLLGTGPTAANENVPGGAAVFGLPGGGADLNLQRPPAPRGSSAGPIVALRVSAGTDVGALLRELEAAGGTITYRDSTHPDQLVVGFTDTDGNNLELLVPR